MEEREGSQDGAIALAAAEYARNVRGLNHKKTAEVDFVQGARYVMERHRWHDAKEEQPAEGEMVIARKRGAWTNLATCGFVNNGGHEKSEFRWYCGNSYRDWKPDEWMYLPE